MAAAGSDHASMSAEDDPAIYARLRPYLEDENFYKYKRHMQALGPGSGRSRPCNVEPVPILTNHLLLQLGLLRLILKETWASMRAFAAKLLPIHQCLDTLVRSAEAKAEKQNLTSKDEILLFLGEEKDVVYPKNSPFCVQYGVTTDFLLSENNSVIPKVRTTIPCGLVVELERFKGEKKLPPSAMLKWLSALVCSNLTENQMKKKIADLMKKYNRATRDRSRKPEQYKNLLETSFESHSSTGTQETSASSSMATLGDKNEGEIFADSTEPDNSPPCPKTDGAKTAEGITTSSTTAGSESETESGTCRSCAQLQLQLNRMCGELLKFKMTTEVQQEKSNIELEAIAAGRLEALKQKNENIAALSVKIEDLKRQLTEAEEKGASTEKSLAQNMESIANMRKSVTTKRRQVNRLRRLSLQKTKENRKLQDQLKLLKEQMETQQLQFKKQTRESKRELCKLRSAFNKLSVEYESLQLDHKEKTTPVYRTKEEGRYTDSVRDCAGQLVSEFDVGAARVPQIIQSVAKHVFNTDIPLSDLPSKSTIIRCVDEAHVLSKLHVSEELQTKRFDLHTDGTTRDRKKYIGQQVTLEDRTVLSLGYQRIASETATSLTDMTMALIQELSSLKNDDPDETRAAVKHILKNLTATMTDRASVMKAFSRELELARKAILGTDSGLEFLYCCAHFLLGLSSGAEKALIKVEKNKNINKQLGRDSLPTFSHFRNSTYEPAALRVVRTTCDVLGPRGDDKNGCREGWTAFCLMKSIQSRITSFRSNRFNNTFEGAAAILHHYEDIIIFISSYLDQVPNLKIQSVLADLKDDRVVMMLAVLATVYVSVSGPFWMLIRSNVHYLDLHMYIQKMDSSLRLILEDDEHFNLWLGNLPSALDTVMEETPLVTSVTKYVQQISDETERGLFKDCVKAVCEEFLATIKNQLSDFLPGGKYGSPASEDDRHRMAHCQTNNLLGEACLGDLDFSLNKRRYARSFYHSTINLMKRNQSLSTWLPSKSEEEQKDLHKIARDKCSNLRSAYQKQEQDVIIEEKEKLLARMAARKEKERQNCQKRFKIMQDIKACPIGGACLNSKDVLNLVAACHTKTSKVEALKLQLRFYRVVMNSKGTRLRAARKSLEQMISDFKLFLTEFYPSGPPDTPDLNSDDTSCVPTTSTSQNCNEPPLKKRRCHEEDASDSESDVCDSELADSEEEFMEVDFSGSFQSQGQTVAVYYDEQCYIGEVLGVKDASSASITFMQQDGMRNSFFWPTSLDVDHNVLARFIVQWDIQMEPIGRSARKWAVTDFNNLRRRHHIFKLQFCSD